MVKHCSVNLLLLSVVGALCITAISSDSAVRNYQPPNKGNEACRKMPSNWESINLQCGGYGHEHSSCEKVCRALKFNFAHCGTQKYCLCHNGPLSQCNSNTAPVDVPAPLPIPDDDRFSNIPIEIDGPPKETCRKVPADWQNINLYCGGYSSVDGSCDKVCQSLRFTAGECGTETYCLCHDRDPSQC